MTAVEQQAAEAPQQLPDAEEGLAQLFVKADNAIDRRRWGPWRSLKRLC
jgi:hypothetical protein